MTLASARALLITAGMFLLAGCGGLSDVGSQDKDKTPPQAVITVVGQPSTVASGKVTVQARSGGEILLSGKDSVETVLPILTFDWQPQNPAAQQLKIVKRNASTIAFQVPALTVATTLSLQLKVSDSDGKSDTQDVDVVVNPVADPNQFLSYLGTPSTFTVVAVTSQDLVPCTTPGQLNCLSVDMPFTIDVETRASYWDIGGQFNSGSTGANAAVLVDAHSVSGAWLSSLGASPDCNALQNPTFSIPIPALDADDIAAAVQKAAATRVADASRIDEAVLTVTVKISQPAGAAALPAGTPQVCVPQFGNPQVAIAGMSTHAKSRLPIQRAPDGASTQVEFTVNELLAALAPPADPNAGGAAVQDTLETATAYFATIDEAGDATQKQTFLGWLKSNGFLPAASGPAIDWAAVAAGSDAHATYVNNFDLGFGRDMYERKLRCNPVSANPQPGDCDVASVVINYGSLEAAAKKLGPQLAVAMEYSRKGTTGPRFVKFYTYAPNVQCDPSHPPVAGCSQFERVLSANLDGRGEKFMPGACTICHGGTPRGLDAADHTQYASHGDVNAAFLLWDRKSFLFSDSPEAGFPDDPTNAVHHQLWMDTRQSVQADPIKALNQLTALTFVDPEGQANRYALPRQLVEGWYSGAGGAYNPDFVPPQWDTDAQQHALYLNVFAQYCRTCHVAQVPNPAPANAGVDPFEKCAPEDAAKAYLGRNHQIVFGCYQQLVNTSSLPDRIAAGQMPAARLTMDRFWVNGSKPAAQFLAEHLDVPLASLAPQAKPVLDVLSVSPSRGAEPLPQTFDPVTHTAEITDRGSLVRLVGSLDGPTGPFTWSVKSQDGATVPLSGEQGLNPSFLVPGPGVYSIAFSAGATTLDRTVLLPNWKPVAKDDATTAAPGQRVTVAVTTNDKAIRDDRDPSIESPLDQGDGPYVTELCTAVDQCSRAAVVTASGGKFEFDTATSAVVAYTPAANFSGTEEVLYRLGDIDQERSSATLSVKVQSKLVASPTCAAVESTALSAVFPLAVTGGVPKYTVSFDPAVTGLSLVSDVLNTYQFQAPALDANADPQIFTGAVATTYTALDAGGTAQQTSSSSLRIPVFPQEAWSRTTGGGRIKELLNVLQSTAVGGLTCKTCHTAAPAIVLTGDSDADYAALSGVTNTADPANSLLFRCPMSGAGACGPNPAHPKFFAFGDATYLRLLRWVQEGSQKNSRDNAAYNCP
jgi:hypothetical protein